MPDFDAVSPVPALAPVAPPMAPDDEPPAEPDESVTDELPSEPVPDDDEPIAPDELVLEPVLEEPTPDVPAVPDSDEPDEPVDDEPPVEPIDELLDEPLEPMLPVAPALPEPLMLEPVDGLELDDALPDRLPDEPALADEPGMLLFRLPDLSSLPKPDWSLPMLLPLPSLPASTPFPSFDF